ncbi:MAG: sirohydrochlorin cobaltochelatase [Desulfuromonas sp.]|nr:sirohydrochlorin cobaltochelatase [Desulfuromonas sp.]
MIRSLTLALVLLMTINSTISLASPSHAEDQKKPAIVLVAFGTSVANARAVFDFIDQQARERYTGYELRWAFTSQFIIDKLKKQGETTYNVAEVIAQLRSEGHNQVVFQSLHVVPGEEYRSVIAADTSGLQVTFGNALLTSDDDIEAAIAALAPNIDSQQPTVIVAHGNDKHPQFNVRLEALATAIEGRYPQLVVASVEGTPGIAPLEKIKALNPSCVNFVPLMIVAGDHIMNDVLGDEPESWKNIIAAPQTDSAPSLGWNKQILNIYFNHLDRAIAKLADRNKNKS